MGATAASGKLVVSCLMKCRHSKVGNLDLTFRTDEDVLRLQIAMTYFQRVAIRDGAHKLAEEARRIDFGKMPIPCDVLIQIAVVYIL